MLTIVEAGIDWLTATMRKDKPEFMEWRAKCQDAIRLIGDAGNVLKQHSLQGFRGVGCASGFYGEREEDGMVILRSTWADRLFERCHNIECHVSRLDLQVTAMTKRYDKRLGARARVQASKHNATLPKPRKRIISARDDDDGGYTLYIGSRSSTNFGRLYNKAAQKADERYDNCWRWEVQLSNEVATQAAFSLNVTSRPIAELVCSSVWQWYANVGIKPPFNHAEYRSVIYAFKQPPTDAERQLAWLKEQVAPTVYKLRQMGLTDIVTNALGLDRPVTLDQPLDAFYTEGEHDG